MTDFTPEFIEQQLAIAEKATPRPWEVDDAWIYGQVGLVGDMFKTWHKHRDAYPEEVANADYTVAAANHYPDALREIAKLQALVSDYKRVDNEEIARLREASENLMDVIDGMSAQHTGVLWDGVMYAVELLREALGDDNEN